MNQIVNFIENISTIDILDIVIAVCIFVLFKVLSPSISYFIIKMFKFKTKNRKVIKESAFYEPLKIFFGVLGLYLAICFLKEPIGISDSIMQIVTKIFEIISIIVFAKGLAASFTIGSTFVKKIRKKSKKDIDDSMLEFILKIVRIIIYVIAVLVVLALLDVQVNGIIAGLGLGGVIVTLAAQDTAKNLFGGAILFVDKPFNVGDWIEVSNFEGTVEDITFRTTRIRTFENAVVNIPNSIIADSSITNWSRMQKRRYKVDLLVEIDTPLEKLNVFKQKVVEMLEAREGIHDDYILVRFDEIKPSGINILIYTYTVATDYAVYLREKEDINSRIMKILKEENIKLAYDTKTVYVKN